MRYLDIGDGVRCKFDDGKISFPNDLLQLVESNFDLSMSNILLN